MLVCAWVHSMCVLFTSIFVCFRVQLFFFLCMGLNVHSNLLRLIWDEQLGRKQKPLRLIRDGEVGGGGIYFISSINSLHCHH